MEASVYIFSFSFSEASSVKYQSHWLNSKWMSSTTNLPPPYLFLDFQFPVQEKSASFPYKAHWIPRDSINPRKTVDSQPQYVVVRKIHTSSNGLLVQCIIWCSVVYSRQHVRVRGEGLLQGTAGRWLDSIRQTRCRFVLCFCFSIISLVYLFNKAHTHLVPVPKNLWKVPIYYDGLLLVFVGWF